MRDWLFEWEMPRRDWPIPWLDFHGLCLQPTPLNTSHADFTSGFPSGLAKGATWDLPLMYANGKAMGHEYHSLGADTILETVCGSLGRFNQQKFSGLTPRNRYTRSDSHIKHRHPI